MGRELLGLLERLGISSNGVVIFVLAVSESVLLSPLFVIMIWERRCRNQTMCDDKPGKMGQDWDWSRWELSIFEVISYFRFKIIDWQYMVSLNLGKWLILVCIFRHVDIFIQLLQLIVIPLHTVTNRYLWSIISVKKKGCISIQNNWLI